MLQPYETTSRHSSPLYMLVVLEGNVALAVNEQTFLLSAGMAFCSQLSEQQTIRAHHGADSKLRTLSLGMYPDGGWRERLPVSLADEWENSAASAMVWQVPEFLLSGLRYAQQPGPHAASRQLMLEGIMLQLLGYALNLCQPATQKRGLPVTGEYQRLELIRRLLEQTPEKAYTLNELARRAAMSPSSLRCKFRHAYGCTVFDYLRDCRLARARRYLMEGYSVQQAAWMSGYQHATNFATAFRRRYGCSPGELRDASLTAYLDKNNVSTRAALLYLFDNGVAPYLSYSTAFTPTSFADENGNVLEPMKGKQWEAGVKYEPPGGIASLAPPCIVLTRPISRPKKNLPIRTARLVKLSLKGLNWRPLAICRIASVCRRRIPILISVIRKVARKSRVSARFMLHGTRPAPG